MQKRLGLYRLMAKIYLGQRLDNFDKSLGWRLQKTRIDLIYNNKLTPKGKREIEYILKTFPFLFSFDGLKSEREIESKRDG